MNRAVGGGGCCRCESGNTEVTPGSSVRKCLLIFHDGGGPAAEGAENHLEHCPAPGPYVCPNWKAWAPQDLMGRLMPDTDRY